LAVLPGEAYVAAPFGCLMMGWLDACPLAGIAEGLVGLGELTVRHTDMHDYTSWGLIVD
jgi:hypothetical protein